MKNEMRRDDIPSGHWRRKAYEKSPQAQTQDRAVSPLTKDENYAFEYTPQPVLRALPEHLRKCVTIYDASYVTHLNV